VKNSCFYCHFNDILPKEIRTFARQHCHPAEVFVNSKEISMASPDFTDLPDLHAIVGETIVHLIHFLEI
jgi:hypothetical protein